MAMRREVVGFTLIELMIVVAVVAILAAIAVPAYNEQVRKSRRSEATSGLSQLALLQERWRANNPAYGTMAQIGSGAVASSYYTFTVTGTPDATTYTLSAAPAGASAACRGSGGRACLRSLP